MTLLPEPEKREKKAQDEVWYDDGELAVYYHLPNNSLHFVDIETNYRIGPAVFCKDREHAVGVVERSLKIKF